ncbi:MAG TPA: cytochrome c oxidase subunit II [Longimicrobiales bacterium]
MLFLIQAAGDAVPVEHPQTTFHPVTDFGVTLNELFANTFWWTMSILALVVILTLVIAIRFREKPGDAQPKAIHGHTLLEIGWTLIPAIIVIFLTIPTVKVIFETQAKPPADALTVEVIGHQWWWEFRYPEEGVVTANELWVPVGRPIHLVMHSADVIHSFWIPRLGGKRDVNPIPRGTQGEKDKRNHLMFTMTDSGSFSGQCAEFCGESHAIMRVSARAVSADHFQQWVNAMKPAGPVVAPTGENATQIAMQSNTSATTPVAPQQNAAGQQPAAAQAPALDLDQLPAPTGIGSAVRPEISAEQWAAAGRKVFESSMCVACHTIAGTPAAGVLGPNLTRFGARPTVGAGAAPNNMDNLQRWIHEPQSLKPGALMPGAVHGIGDQAPTGLSSREIYAVASYLMSLK